jgi:hypothetical protein
MTNYLLGVLYYQVEDYKNAVIYLNKLENNMLDVYRYLGESYFFTKDLKNSRIAFNNLLNKANNNAQKIFAQDWLNRLNFIEVLR